MQKTERLHIFVRTLFFMLAKKPYLRYNMRKPINVKNPLYKRFYHFYMRTIFIEILLTCRLISKSTVKIGRSDLS